MRYHAIEGVVNTTVGYTGGPSADPTYASVCAGDGHTEALRVEFDPSAITFEEIMTEFFEDPHVRYVFGGATGRAQYKTAIWAQNDEQCMAARRVSAEVGKEVPILPAETWWDAEAWHQHFLGGEFNDIPDDAAEEGYAPF